MNDELREHPLRFRLHLLHIVAVAAVFFVSGFWTSSLLHGDRVREEGNRRMLEALVNLIQSGVIAVNEDRLAEMAAEDAGTNGVGTASACGQGGE